MDEWITAESLKATKRASRGSGIGAVIAALAAAVVPQVGNVPNSVLIAIIATAGALVAVAAFSEAVDAAARAYVAAHHPEREVASDGQAGTRDATPDARGHSTLVALLRPIPVAVHQATGYLATCVELGADHEPARYFVARSGRPPAWVPAGGVSVSPDLALMEAVDLRVPVQADRPDPE